MLVDRSASTNEQDLINYGRSTVSINGEFILTKKSNNRLRFWDYKSGYDSQIITHPNPINLSSNSLTILLLLNQAQQENFISMGY